MISIKYNKEQDIFLAKGTFEFGVIGIFENNEYGEGNISLSDDSMDMILDYDWKEYTPLIGQCGEDADKIASFLEKYYNQKEEEIRENKKQLDDCFWCFIFNELYACEYPFWEIEEAIAPQYRGRDWEAELQTIYADNAELFNQLEETFLKGSPNNGTIQKIDAEKELRRIFYMFNFEGLAQEVKRDYIVFEGPSISPQVTDNWGGDILMSALLRYNMELALVGWDNL